MVERDQVAKAIIPETVPPNRERHEQNPGIALAGCRRAAAELGFHPGAGLHMKDGRADSMSAVRLTKTAADPHF